MTNLLTVSELTSLAPDLDLTRYDDPTISGMLTSASELVADYLEFTPYAEDIVNEIKEASITTEGDLLIFPSKLPIISVSAMAVTKGATSINLTLVNGNGNNKYNIDYNRRHIRYPYGEITLQGVPVFTNFYALKSQQFYVSLSYRGGWEPSDLPHVIKMATVLYFRDLMSGSYNTTGATRVSQGGVSYEFASRDGKSQLVLDAEKLLRPYRRVG